MQKARDCLQSLKLFILLLPIFISLNVYPQNISLPNAYAHNDYWHKRPLYDALDMGFTHIEADIYLRDNKLVVAHVLPRLRMHKTLDSLYLKPLLACINGIGKDNHCPDFPVTLMIDIKSDANETYLALKQLLEKYRPFLSVCKGGIFKQGKITIVLTGHKPIALLKAEKDRLAFVDEDLLQVKKDTLGQNFYQTASCRYSHILNWKGNGPIPYIEHQRLCTYVAEAHRYGKKVRLWASPENSMVWRALLDCGVDLINTDQLEKLKDFLQYNGHIYAKAD